MNLEIDEKKVADKLDIAGVPASMREQIVDNVLETLQTTVAMRLEEELSDDELLQFQQYAEQTDASQGVEWIRKRFPNYEQIVDEELSDIVNDLKRTVDGIKSQI